MKEQLLENIEYVGIFIGIIVLTAILATVVGKLFRRVILKNLDEEKDPTSYRFIHHVLIAMIYIVGFGVAIYVMPNLRALAGSLLAGAGILAVAIGFASQHALSNVISGLFLVVFKPFRIRDRIKFRDVVGIVEDITLRHTVVRDFENKRLIIPNSIISDEMITNLDYQDERSCRFIDISISYDSDLALAKSIIKEEIMNHPLFIDHRNELQIMEGDELAPVKVIGLGDSSVNLRGWAWALNSPDGFEMYCDLLESIKLRFDKEGIEIPFPHRTLVSKNLEASIITTKEN